MSKFNEFSKEELITIVNKELELQKSKIRVTSFDSAYGNDYASFKTEKKETIIVQPVAFYPKGKIGIRSIHKIRKGARNFKYLFNGQASTNLINLVFNGEEGVVHTVT